MEIIKDIEQGSQEWLDLRLGKVTASKFSAVLSKGKTKGAVSKTRQTYMMQLVAERITHLQQGSFTNAAMEWGTETEPQAREMYEFMSGNEVEQCAFILHDEFVGVSPDGLIGDDGLVEFKCPNTSTQIEYYLKGEFPSTYEAQVQGQLWVAQRQWCDFVSFDPRIAGPSGYFCIRVERDEEYINDLKDKVYIFIDEMMGIIKRLES